jgi:two-component system OmpR family response regulator
MKVLIVDESTGVCERLSGVLSELKGIESIAQAKGCLEAATSTKKNVPDVVLFDIRTHEGQWTDDLQQIKNSKSAPTLIVLSNCTHPHVRTKCMDLGADFFFDKSTEFDRVLDALKELTSQGSETSGHTSNYTQYTVKGFRP